VNDGGDVAEIIRAAIAIDASVVGEEDFAPSISTGLVDLHRDEVLFRHPLVRSAIYQAASALQRRTAHGALAAAIEAEPDRRAWHLAASVTGLDEDIAGELDTAAERAQRRGGIAVAVAALERAAQLSVDSHRRAGRLLRAAELAYEQGRPDFVIQLMQEASQLELSPQDAARVLWLTGVSSSQGTDDGQMLVDLQEAAEAMRVANQADLALKLLTAAAQRCYYSEPPDEVRQSIVESLDRLDLEETDSRLLVALAFAAPIGRGAALMERLTRVRTAAQEGSQELTNLGTAAALLSDDDNTLRFLTSAVAAARRQGRLGLLPPILHSLAWAETHRGNWTLALPAAEEAIQIAREMSQELFAVGALVLQALQDAMRGNALSAEDRSREIERLGHLTGSAAILCVNQLARGVAALAKADYDAAYAQLVRVFDPSDAAFHFTRCWAIGDLAEAALHTGRADSVRGLLPSMDEIAQQSPLPWLQAGLSYAKALLANENEAESMFGAALAQDLTNRPFFRGRIQLEFGVWLRRRQRTAEARISLRAARDTLDTFGAVPWADRARNELRAAGESSHVRSPSIGEQLTPQELQIAHLASKGLSNREIGQQLFLSHRTVGSHLYRIFPKLGITSRAQLASLLNSTSDPVHP
jgi:DNA-binding CsgD family transcriptional regulator